MARSSRAARRRKQIITQHAAGVPIEQIAQSMRVRKSTIQKLLAATGVPFDVDVNDEPVTPPSTRRLGTIYERKESYG